jgi:hypothetical protein
MRAMTSGTGGSGVGINVPVSPKARSATTSISAAAAHDMIISRSCGSTMRRARLVSATTSTCLSQRTKRQGCVLWPEGASTA